MIIDCLGLLHLTMLIQKFQHFLMVFIWCTSFHLIMVNILQIVSFLSIGFL